MRLEDLVTDIDAAKAANRREEVRALAGQLLERLRAGEALAPDAGLEAALALRDVRAFDLLEALGQQLSGPGDAPPAVRRLFAQSLIEQRKVGRAREVLRALLDSEPVASAEWAEATGLMGRTYKDAVVAARDQTSAETREDLAQAIAYYQAAYAQDRERYVWQAINVLALSSLARRVAPDLPLPAEPGAMADEVVRTLKATAPERRDRWYHASLAEALIALGRWEEVERHIGTYARDPATTAFQLAGTLRQLTRLWRLEDLGDRPQGLVETLRAGLLTKEGGEVRLDPGQLKRALGRPDLPANQAEAVLGEEGLQTYAWWLQGTKAALSVALIRRGSAGQGIGTGFVVRGGDLVPALGDELLLLTNAHVVTDDPGADEGLRPSVAKVCFLAAMGDGAPPHAVAGIVWRSPRDRLDASLLRLSPPPPADKVAPLPLSPDLPVLEEKNRVYVVGHPNGGELFVSMRDNELLDHEGPPKGTPPDPVCRRVHYHAPTEEGMSGSPVFNDSNWEVIALHHRGGKAMPRLNGQEGEYKANQGIWISSIVEAATRENA